MNHEKDALSYSGGGKKYLKAKGMLDFTQEKREQRPQSLAETKVTRLGSVNTPPQRSSVIVGPDPSTIGGLLMTFLLGLIKAVPVLDRWAQDVSAYYWAWRHKKDVERYYDALNTAHKGDMKELQKEVGKHL